MDSIPLLESAFRDGIGINKPAYIDLKGFDAFANHKRWLREQYPGCAAGSYPLENSWGNAKTQDDFNSPVDVDVTCRKTGNGYVFDYKASEPTPCNHHLARIDLLVNGVAVHRVFDDLTGGSVSVNLEKYSNQKVKYRIAAWDMALNCTLSEEKKFMVD